MAWEDESPAWRVDPPLWVRFEVELQSNLATSPFARLRRQSVPTVTIDPQECAGVWPEDSPGPSLGELYLDGIYGA